MASEFARLGGKGLVRKYGSKHMGEIGKKGAESRWGKKDEEESDIN